MTTKEFISFTDLASKEVLEESDPVEYLSFEFELKMITNDLIHTHFAEIVKIQQKEVIILHLHSINYFIYHYNKLIQQFTERDLLENPKCVFIIEYSYGHRISQYINKCTNRTTMDEIVNFLNQ